MCNLISVAVDLDAVLKIFSTERAGKIGGAIDQKHGEKFSSDRGRIRRKEPIVGEICGFRERLQRTAKYSSSLTRIDF
jgi:hypothetical protein